MDLFGLTQQDLNNFNGAEMTDLALKTLFPQDEMTDLDPIAFNKSGNSPDFTMQFDYWSDIIERFKVMPSNVDRTFDVIHFKSEHLTSS